MKTFMKFSVGLIFLFCARCLIAQPNPGTVLWSFDVGRLIRGSPSVGFDGTVYVASDIALQAITNNGSVASNKWVLTISALDSPAIGANGTLYLIGGNDAQLHALNPDSTTKWVGAPTGGLGSPAIGLDGALYFVADGRLHALEPSGAIRWNCVLEVIASYWHRVKSPIIGRDGTVYVGLSDKLHAIGPSGTNKWSHHLDGMFESSPALSESDSIFISAGPLYAFSSDGTNLWAALPPTVNFDGPPAIGKDGEIYAAAFGIRTLYAFNFAGEENWSTISNVTARSPSTSPAIDQGGNIYYCVSNSVFALNSQGQVLWTIATGYPLQLGDISITSPAIGPDGTLYAALGSTLYAIATGTNGPADSPWPMYRGNARHTGKIEKPALKQPKKRADANFEFQLYAQLGQTNVIETTTNLSTWTSLTSVVVTTVPQPVVDLTASNQPSRFYRAFSP